MHAVVARSTFRSQNVQSTSKHTRFGPLLEVEMSKKCTPLWCEAHFDVKMYKTHQVRTCSDHFWTLRCRKKCTPLWSTFRSQNVKSTTCSRHFWTFRCRFAWQAQGIVHLVKSKQNVGVLWHFQKRWQLWDI